MIAFLRFFVPLLIVQTVLYVAVRLHTERRERQRLRAQWEARGRPGDAETFVARGLNDFGTALRRRLLLAIYVVPWVALIAIIQWVNR